MSAMTSRLTNEINVTPMIDVLLVLLIIFMAALPTMRKSVDVSLPEPRTDSTSGGPPSIVLEIGDAGDLSINHQPIPAGGLAARIHAIYDGRPEKILFVKGSRRVKYDVVLGAMDVARGAGVKAIGLP